VSKFATSSENSLRKQQPMHTTSIALSYTFTDRRPKPP